MQDASPASSGQPAPMRLLITAVGSLVATNLLEALVRVGRERFYVIGVNSDAESPNNFDCDVAYTVPATAAGTAFAEALLAIAEIERPELWIPGRDADVLALAKLHAAGKLAGQALVGSVQAADTMDDKWLSYCFAKAHGLPVVPTANTLDAAASLAQQYGYPLIVKPCRGFGSIGVRFVTDEVQLARALAASKAIAQPVIAPEPGWWDAFPDPADGMPLWFSYVDPGQYASTWLIEPGGQPLEIGSTLNTMVCGRPERSVRVDEPALTATGSAYARALAAFGWRGPLAVQCRRADDGSFLMVELMGRYAGGLGAREVLGMGEVATMLAAYFPERFPVQHMSDSAILTRKRPQTLGIAGSALRQLQETGVWRRTC